jgi:hypothetical protein
MCRRANVRRSWMRRARMALAMRSDLTAAERHEIMCVWSRAEVSHIASPALSKVLKRPIDKACQHLPYRRYLRARFTERGDAITRLAAPRMVVREAANDDWFDVPRYACGQIALF